MCIRSTHTRTATQRNAPHHIARHCNAQHGTGTAPARHQHGTATAPPRHRHAWRAAAAPHCMAWYSTQTQSATQFAYYHLTIMICELYLLVLAYVGLGVTPPYAIGGYLMTLIALLGLREAAGCLADPLGQDECDIPVFDMIRDTHYEHNYMISRMRNDCIEKPTQGFGSTTNLTRIIEGLHTDVYVDAVEGKRKPGRKCVLCGKFAGADAFLNPEDLVCCKCRDTHTGIAGQISVEGRVLEDTELLKSANNSHYWMEQLRNDAARADVAHEHYLTHQAELAGTEGKPEIPGEVEDEDDDFEDYS